MNSLAQKFLNPSEQQKVTEAVRQAELQTSGEIVPMIVSRSYDYPRAKLAASLLLSLPLTHLMTHMLSSLLWLNPENIYFYFSLLVPLFFLCHLLFRKLPSLTRIFISQEEMKIEVEEEAVKSFFQEQLYDTQEKNGILIFISVFEKKAWILADHGIQQKIEPHTWDNLIDELTAEIGAGNRCDGLCRAITEVGDILARHFPYHKDDKDELHNLIIR